jgi:hypothetical protein
MAGSSGYATTVGLGDIVVPTACTVQSLTVYPYVISGAEAETLTVTVYYDDSPELMSVSVPTTTSTGPGTTQTDNTHTFTVAAGHRLSLSFTENVSDSSHSATIGYSTVLICQ